MFSLTNHSTPSGFRIIRLDDGMFTGVEFCFTKVNFHEENDSMRVQFEYNVIEGHHLIESHESSFKSHISGVLDALLFQSVESGNIVFKGGK